ncbi:hypothetical protein IIC38_19645 [candidate division KSB1 bacterium]|nr:hypothetical protein [candidate division KSB1 bacterium]
MRQYKAFQKKRESIQGKTIVGIDPANDKHQGVVINEFGLPIGNSFHFSVSFEGYTTIKLTGFNRPINPYIANHRRTVKFRVKRRVMHDFDFACSAKIKCDSQEHHHESLWTH